MTGSKLFKKDELGQSRYMRLRNRAFKAAVSAHLRVHALIDEPEKGTTTAEYAVVIVAATGFAGLLIAVLKSDAVKGLLSSLVEKALQTS